MGVYEFYKNFCVCPGTPVYLGMRDLDGLEVSAFPVFVFNINEEEIGFATNKQEYIDIWNSDEDNRGIGTLTGLIGPFSFTLILKPGFSPPQWVIGDPDGGLVPVGALTDDDGEPLTDDDGSPLTDE